MLALRKTGGVVGDDVELQVVTGSGWDELSTPPTGRKATCRPSAPRRRAESPRCSWARADQRSCGTVPFRFWCRPANPARADAKVPNTPTFLGTFATARERGLVLRGSAIDGDL